MMRMMIAALADPRTGTGHLRRMITLGEALLDQADVELTFQTTQQGASILEKSPLSRRIRPTMISSDAPKHQALMLLAALDGRSVDCLILDNYHWSAANEAPLKAHVGKLVAFDDLADRPHEVDILIDQNANREAADYASLTPAGCMVLAGPDYVLTPRAFREMRDAGALWSPDPDAPIFLSLGGGDPNDDLPALAEALLEETGFPLLVTTGGHIAGRRRLEALVSDRPHRLRLAIDSDTVARDLRTCRFAITAGGTMTWERAVLGVPSISLILADNQAEATDWLARRDLIEAFDIRGDWAKAGFIALVERFDADAPRRLRMSRQTSELITGRGVANIASVLVSRERQPPQS